MCMEPVFFGSGKVVACRKCKRCKWNRVNDYVGRCIAESKYAKATYAVTLTYDEKQGVNTAVLVYDDVQRFLKRLRKKHKVRFICAGEYGTQKGRAHWHIVLFFQDSVPEVEQGKRIQWDVWPHGFSYFQKPDWKGFKYVLKYVLKDQSQDSAANMLTMSKNPPIGWQFFSDLADEHVKQGIIPRSYVYKIGGVRDDDGIEKKFLMRGVTREKFLSRFVTEWEQKYGKQPESQFLDEKWYNSGSATYGEKSMRYVPFKFGGIRETASEAWVDYGHYVEGYYDDTVPFIVHYRTYDDTIWVYSEGGGWWLVEEHETEFLAEILSGKITRRIQHEDLVEECQALEDKSQWIISNGINLSEILAYH